MSKYKNFTLGEFIASTTALKKGIDNSPSFEVVEHLNELVGTILQPLREAYGKPLTISSGYRCTELNKAVGGVQNSAHQYGYAADVQCKDLTGFINFAEGWLKANNVPFDQSIREKAGKTEWWHIAVRNPEGKQRRMYFSISK